MAIFTQNTPQGSQFPSTSRPLMLANNQYTAAFGGRDHQFTEDSANAEDGTHKQVTLTNQATPGYAGASSVLYANTANGQSNLFFNNAAINGQLTSFKAGVPTAATNGCSCLPGGMLIQWGVAAGIWNNTNTVTFPVAFSGTPYSVTANEQFAAYTIIEFVQITSLTTTTFKPVLQSSSGGATTTSRTLYWMAIGPA